MIKQKTLTNPLNLVGINITNFFLCILLASQLEKGIHVHGGNEELQDLNPYILSSLILIKSSLSIGIKSMLFF